MATKKVGTLVKEARSAAGLTQEKLAKQAGENLTAKDISNCENGKADLTAAQLKKIAIVCGVTQKSLVEAPKNLGSSTAAKKTATAAKKPASAATTSTAKKTAAKTDKKPAAKKTAKTTVPANANTSVKVTAAEKKLIDAYREASADNKKIALKVLKGEYGDTVTNLLGVAGGSSSSAADNLGELLGNVVGNLFGGNK